MINCVKHSFVIYENKFLFKTKFYILFVKYIITYKSNKSNIVYTSIRALYKRVSEKSQ